MKTLDSCLTVGIYSLEINGNSREGKSSKFLEWEEGGIGWYFQTKKNSQRHMVWNPLPLGETAE